jgi:chemotaxis signal transduction protein
MNDYIVFTVGTNAYAIDVTYVERIIQIPSVTPVVNAHPFVDGMIVYEKKTTKILNFRKAVGMVSQEEELARTFIQVKKDHEAWIEALKAALDSGSEFGLTTDPHACRLGKWLDSYTSHDPQVIALLQGLIPLHIRLHEYGKEILNVRENDPSRAAQMFQNEMVQLYAQTTGQLDKMIGQADSFAKYQQKLVIYHGNETLIAVKVDGIEDIAVIDESAIKPYDHEREIGGCLSTRGVVEHKGKLVIVVESVSLPNDGA